MKDENDRYKNIKPGDTIVFESEESHEQIITLVQFVHHYPTIRKMLEKEGVENVLSSEETIEKGIEHYNAIGNYKERVSKFGMYAIGIRPIE